MNSPITEYRNHQPKDEDIGRQAGQAKTSLGEFIRNGGWFCGRCDRVVNLPLDLDEPGSCPHCKKPTCKYHPPVKELQMA